MSMSFQSFIELRKRLDGMQRLLRDRSNVKEKKGFPPQDVCRKIMVRINYYCTFFRNIFGCKYCNYTCFITL